MLRRSLCDGPSLAEKLGFVMSIQDWLLLSDYVGNGCCRLKKRQNVIYARVDCRVGNSSEQCQSTLAVLSTSGV